ncbi:hypothetical protein ACHAP9_003410 [Verticillium nonalfalfae]
MHWPSYKPQKSPGATGDGKESYLMPPFRETFHRTCDPDSAVFRTHKYPDIYTANIVGYRHHIKHYPRVMQNPELKFEQDAEKSETPQHASNFTRAEYEKTLAKFMEKARRNAGDRITLKKPWIKCEMRNIRYQNHQRAKSVARVLNGTSTASDPASASQNLLGPENPFNWLVVDSFAGNSAAYLCSSNSSRGPDFANAKEKMFCLMSDKTLHPFCADNDKKTADGRPCFDLESQQLVRGGIVKRDSPYVAVMDWRFRKGIAVVTRPVSVPKDAVAVYGFQTPDNASPQPVNTAPGFLGFTSFSGIYDEARSNLSLLHPQTVTVSLDFEARKDPKETRRSQMLAPAVLETCLVVLRHIPDERRGRSLFKAHYNLCDGWTQPVALKTLNALYKAYGEYFDDSRDDVKLTKLAHIICENTRRPFSENERDPVKWAAQFSGHNTRWETLGVLFTYWRMGAIVHDYTQQPFGPVGSMSCGFTRKHEMHQQCLKNCAELARAHSESGNTMLLYVFFKRMILESVSAGDASLSCWQYHAESVSLMTFLGLHAETNTEPYIPSLASETRRRLFYCVYNIDKVVSSFVGRPPMISRRYFSTPPPLDLRDEYLLADEATMMKGVSALDANGWNTEGALYPTTIIRARVKMASIRDEIMEIAMGNGTTSIEALLNIKAQHLAIWASFPDVLILKPDDIKDASLEMATLYSRIIIRLEYLQNLFFLERLLVRRGHNSSGELLSVSFDMVTTTLMTWTNMDRLGIVQSDLKWLVMAFAAPGGGILCLELLKPTLHGTHPSNPSIDRSRIVQKLSLLVGFLEWVGDEAPNGNLCAHCRALVQHVLDQTLNPPPEGAPGLEMADFDFSTQADFNFELLDTFDWLRPENMPAA